MSEDSTPEVPTEKVCPGCHLTKSGIEFVFIQCWTVRKRGRIIGQRTESYTTRHCTTCLNNFTETCPSCRKARILIEYYSTIKGNGEYVRDPECQHCRRRARKRSERSYRSGFRNTSYRISTKKFLSLSTTQGGVCAICRRGPATALHVDHCHTTRKIRSLLCPACNKGIGLFQDDPARLRAAADYLERHRNGGTSPGPTRP